MTIGIGGAGSKLAAKLDPKTTVVNVSDNELHKVEAGKRILAAVHTDRGQFRGSRKDPDIGKEAYQSIRRELTSLSRGDIVFASTGGGTGNGIASALLEDITDMDEVLGADKTSFVFVLPYPKLESTEFVNNTITFLTKPLSQAIDKGNTGNIMLFSNKLKFENRIAEDVYNQMIVDSLKVFLAIPEKNANLKLLDGHIDDEDFNLYKSRPFFNHFTYFDYSPSESFEQQLAQNYNPLLLPPENPIEALFLLEVPSGWDSTIFYNILDHFSSLKVTPVYSVVENPELQRPFVTISLLYSRKPAELLEDFNDISRMYAKEKVKKSVEQHVELKTTAVNMTSEAKKMVRAKGGDEEILNVLKRLGKL